MEEGEGTEVVVTEAITGSVKPEEIDEVAVFTSHDTLQTVPEDICTTAQPDILRLTTSSTVTAVLKRCLARLSTTQ